MFLLILDSLGSTELFFILLDGSGLFWSAQIAPNEPLSGKEHRRVSQGLRRLQAHWEREVALESESENMSTAQAGRQLDIEPRIKINQFPEPMIEPVPGEQ